MRITWNELTDIATDGGIGSEYPLDLAGAAAEIPAVRLPQAAPLE
jgi:hypothetical protein